MTLKWNSPITSAYWCVYLIAGGPSSAQDPDADSYCKLTSLLKILIITQLINSINSSHLHILRIVQCFGTCIGSYMIFDWFL